MIIVGDTTKDSPATTISAVAMSGDTVEVFPESASSWDKVRPDLPVKGGVSGKKSRGEVCEGPGTAEESVDESTKDIDFVSGSNASEGVGDETGSSKCGVSGPDASAKEESIIVTSGLEAIVVDVSVSLHYHRQKQGINQMDMLRKSQKLQKVNGISLVLLQV
jgi:hypothetical protein